MCLAGFAIIVSQICSVFLCFVGGIFRFANLPSGFAKFLGFFGFLVWIGLLDLGIHLDGKKIAKKML